MESQEYVDLLRSVWEGQDVTVISEPESKLLSVVRLNAKSVIHIGCPSYSAYSTIDDLQHCAYKAGRQRVLISCGPTATCLANRLAGIGLQGVDLGSVGGLIARWPKR